MAHVSTINYAYAVSHHVDKRVDNYLVELELERLGNRGLGADKAHGQHHQLRRPFLLRPLDLLKEDKSDATRAGWPVGHDSLVKGSARERFDGPAQRFQHRTHAKVYALLEQHRGGTQPPLPFLHALPVTMAQRPTRLTQTRRGGGRDPPPGSTLPPFPSPNFCQIWAPAWLTLIPSLVTSTSTVMRPRTLPSSSERNSLVMTEYCRGSLPNTALT